jgi:hypothetical protein
MNKTGGYFNRKDAHKARIRQQQQASVGIASVHSAQLRRTNLARNEVRTYDSEWASESIHDDTGLCACRPEESSFWPKEYRMEGKAPSSK